MTQDDAMREAFEAWRRKQTKAVNKDNAVARHGFGDDAPYVSDVSNAMWVAWQEATRQAVERHVQACETVAAQWHSGAFHDGAMSCADAIRGSGKE